MSANQNDTERLDRLEQVLQERDEIHEFWFDPETKLFWVGDEVGGGLRIAVDRLLSDQRKETAA